MAPSRTVASLRAITNPILYIKPSRHTFFFFHILLIYSYARANVCVALHRAGPHARHPVSRLRLLNNNNKRLTRCDNQLVLFLRGMLMMPQPPRSALNSLVGWHGTFLPGSTVTTDDHPATVIYHIIPKKIFFFFRGVRLVFINRFSFITTPCPRRNPLIVWNFLKL